MDHFLLADEQSPKIAQLLPNDMRGRERVDNRRVISGMVNLLKSEPMDERAALSLRAE